MQSIVLAGGCFWGMEELLRSQPGVVRTEAGYCGGESSNPTYYRHDGHAEAVLIEYDEHVTTLDVLLDYFFRIHDPTTLNQQGNDIGTSYRSTIFYQDKVQCEASRSAIRRNQSRWDDLIVTTLEQLERFWPAEAEHQSYLQKHPGGYTCHYERS